MGIIIICMELKVMKLRDPQGDGIEYLAGSESKVNRVISIFSKARGDATRMTCAKKGAKKIEEKSRSELLEDKCEIDSRSVEEQLFQMQIRGEPRRDHWDLAA